MAAYLYHVGRLYINEQKTILNKLKVEDKNNVKCIQNSQNQQLKVNDFLEEIKSNKYKLKINKKNIEQLIESDSEVETSEEK